MRLLASQKVRYAIAFLVGSLVGIGYVYSAVIAHADIVSGVSIAGNGLAIIRGARVEQVTANGIVASSKWGKTELRWLLTTDGMTRFSPARDGRALAAMFSEGQFIDFSGQIADGDGMPTVRASSIHNESLMQSATTLSGSVIGIGGSDIVMLGSDGTSTIRLNEGTILTKDGNRADPDDLVPGATIKAFGTFNPQERVLEADRVTSVTSTVPTQPEPKKSTGLLQNISAWLSVRGGALSMRRATKKRV